MHFISSSSQSEEKLDRCSDSTSTNGLHYKVMRKIQTDTIESEAVNLSKCFISTIIEKYCIGVLAVYTPPLILSCAYFESFRTIRKNSILLKDHTGKLLHGVNFKVENECWDSI